MMEGCDCRTIRQEFGPAFWGKTEMAEASRILRGVAPPDVVLDDCVLFHFRYTDNMNVVHEPEAFLAVASGQVSLERLAAGDTSPLATQRPLISRNVDALQY